MAKPQAPIEGIKPKKAARPAAKSAIAPRSLADIDTKDLTPEQVAALAEETATARKRKPSPRSNKNWNVTELAGLPQEERDAAMAEVAAELTKPKRKPRNKVSPETAKVSKKPGKDQPNVKSSKKQAGGEQGIAETPPPEGEKKPMGRPSTFDEAVFEQIIERISSGEPLRAICRDDNMPAWRTVYNWMDADKQLAARFARARDLGEEALGQECLDIADNAANDWMEKYDKDGENIGWQVNGDHVQRSKLRIETRLKLLAKWNPKKWGDKVDVNHGGQAGNPVNVQTKVVLVPAKQAAQVETKPLAKDGD